MLWNSKLMLPAFKHEWVFYLWKVVDKNRAKKTIVSSNKNKAHRHRINPSVQAAKMDDLWPSEAPWAILCQKLSRMKIRKKQGLKKAITEVWRSISKEDCQKLIDAVPIRLKTIIQKEGDRLLGRRTSTEWAVGPLIWGQCDRCSSFHGVMKNEWRSRS